MSLREHQEVSEYERQFENGSDPRVLDIIDVPLLESCPSGHLHENWLLDPKWYWTKVGRLDLEDLGAYVEQYGPLWQNGNSTYSGLNDKIELEDLAAVESSLRLIKVDDMQLKVFSPDEMFGSSKRRVQAKFEHEGTHYWLWVTGPAYERRYLAQSDATHQVGECHLTVSLGEPYKGACYKLVAAVIRANLVEEGSRLP